MKARLKDDPRVLFQLPVQAHETPDRTAGGYFRTAEGQSGQKAIGGVPLQTTEARVVAAVRMAYDVAAEQADRSIRWAQRLRSAGDDAVGGDSERKAVDAAERLVFKSLMAALGWLEAAAAAPGSPAKRLLAAEYRLLGAMLGLQPGAEGARVEPQDAEPRRAAGKRQDMAGDRRSSAVAIHHTGRQRRPVRELKIDIDPGVGEQKPLPLRFYTDGVATPIEGSLDLSQGRRAVLEVKIERVPPPGIWRAAVCVGPQQVGVIEFKL